MMNKNKILGLIGCSALTMGVLISYNHISKVQDNRGQDEDVVENIDLSPTMEDVLLTYNEEGMNVLKANYTDRENMELALKNIGNEISELTLTNIDNKKISLSQFKGEKVIFEIIQDSCEYCAENTPIVNKITKEKEDITVVPIFVNSTLEGIQGFYESLGIEMPDNVLLDENLDTVNEFKLTKTPTLVFMDESGKISLIKQNVYDEVTFNDDLKTAFENDKIYEMKVNN